ncbi:hypothetical protein [Shinella sp. BYT-45]
MRLAHLDALSRVTVEVQPAVDGAGGFLRGLKHISAGRLDFILVV